MNEALQTRCPHCQTVFRVSDAQLAARDGRVRCGRCQRVFDGRLAVIAAGTGPAPSVDQPRDGEARASASSPGKALVDLIPSSVERAKGQPAPPSPGIPGDFEPPETVAEEDPDWLKTWKPRALEELFPEPPAEPVAAPPARAAGSAVNRAREGERRTAPSAGEPPRRAPRAARDEPPITVQPEAPGLGAPGPFAWEDKAARKKRSWLWGALVPVLALALALQAVYQLRHTLAARIPILRPYLAAACERIGCRVEPPRSRDQISIEASDLQADPAHRGLLVLTATLRNRADFAVAYPHLELTLTDLQERAVVRRVLAPAEYAGGTVQITSGIPQNGEVAVKLFIDASATEQQGYRLVLFYP